MEGRKVLKMKSLCQILVECKQIPKLYICEICELVSKSQNRDRLPGET